MAENDDKERVTRRTYPVGAFTIKRSQQSWIADEAKRRKISKSEIIRELIQDEIDRTKGITDVGR